MTTIVNGTTGLTFPDGVTQSSGIAAPGASGNVLTSNGTTWTSAAAVVGLGGMQAFTTAGSGQTFTIPAGVTKVKVTVTGGGGGGGLYGGCSSACGGGAGGTAIKFLSGLTAGNTITVTVGAAGTSPTVDSVAGGTGGTSSIASGTQTITTVSATGGIGGFSSNAGGVSAGNGNGGTASSGDINIKGGGAPQLSPTGGGGASYWGGGGFATSAGSQTPNLAYGAGGGTSTISTIASPGAAGIVVFEW